MCLELVILILIGSGVMVGDAGTIPQMINGCRMCEREDGVVRCTLGQTAVEIDVTDCPGEAVIAGPETLVTGFKGRALSVVLPKTTLTCESFAEGTAATLNAEECLSSPGNQKLIDTVSEERERANRTNDTSTSTTTMKYRLPPFPLPLPEEEEDILNVTLNTTTITNNTTTTTMRDTTTVFIAVTAGLTLNGKLWLCTIGLVLCSAGAIVTVRVIRKRIQTRRNIPRPVQVPIVTSSTEEVQGTLRNRRSRSRETLESIELFRVDNMKRE